MKQVKDINSDTVCFFQKGFNTELDKVLQDSLDGHDQLEAIRVYLSTLCADVTPKTKDTNGGTAIKIHTTAKSPALLLGTSRRVLMVKAQLDSLHKKGKQQVVSLNYFSHYTQQQETLSLDTSTLVYTDHGSAKKEMEITSSQVLGICKSNQQARDTLVTLMQTLFHTFVQSVVTPLLVQLAAISAFITALDTLQCKAYIARKYNFCKPAVMDSPDGDGTIRLAFTELRHPLIEQLQLKELYVTNDLDLKNGLLLYGTNAVGKTSFIKSVGIAVVMAQAGLYVPCSTFRFRPFTALFTRILGNDNLFKGQSTFAVEMSELRTILNLADGNSLVLGDELCSGTESNSALSIFMTGLEELHKRNSVFMFATHFHDIAHYEELNVLTGLLLKHMAVRFDQEQQVLVYDRKLRDGPGQGMYGLEVCKALHLPSGFLDRAHELRRKYESTQSTLALPSNRYSKKKLKNMCELCRVKEASEIHHLQHQKDARSDNGYIGSFHKNHPANLVGICEACHLKTHQSTRQHKLSRAVDSGEVVVCAL
jgi:DNA mismatch repair protein MutS